MYCQTKRFKCQQLLEEVELVGRRTYVFQTKELVGTIIADGPCILQHLYQWCNFGLGFEVLLLVRGRIGAWIRSPLEGISKALHEQPQRCAARQSSRSQGLAESSLTEEPRLNLLNSPDILLDVAGRDALGLSDRRYSPY